MEVQGGSKPNNRSRIFFRIPNLWLWKPATKRFLADNKVVFGVWEDFTYLCKVKSPRWWLPARKDKKVRIILPQKQNENIDATTIKPIRQCVFPLCPKDTAGKLSYLPSASWRIRTHSVRWQGSMPRHTLPWGFKTCHAFEGEHHMCVPEWMVKRELPMKVGRRSTIESSSPFTRNEETSLIYMTSAINMIYSVTPKENRQNSLCQCLQKSWQM